MCSSDLVPLQAPQELWVVVGRHRARALGAAELRALLRGPHRRRFGFRVGGVPPIGYPSRLPALLDEDLFRYPAVWAAAGTDHAFFPITPERLLAMVGGTRMVLKKEAAAR